MSRKTPEWVLRINSAIILIIPSLGLAILSPLAFAVLITVFITAMAWEWGKLVRGQGLDLAFGVQALATGLAAFATVSGLPVSALLIMLAGAAAVFLLRALVGQASSGAWWSAAGVFYAGLPAIALIWLRGDPAYGLIGILYLFAVVWTTDTAAYLFGRGIGGPKLAPRISPKKTWSGFLGGVSCAALAGAAFAAWIGDASGLKLALLGLCLAAAAQFGDLGESAVKRRFGIKDSSGLIPGHGGVLDRLDGLIFAAIAAGLFALAVNPAQPARALLLWS